jgi:hypothetical protein
MSRRHEFIETATSANGIDFISCDLLTFGDYGGAGSVGLANINYLRDKFKPHIEEGGFKVEDEDVADSTELFIANGVYHSQQAWLRDTEENRELLSSLKKYPAFDDQYISDVESEWEEEAWESWVKRELLDFAEDEIVDDPETGEEITLGELLERVGDKEEQDKILYYAYKDAMNETDTYPEPEYSDVSIDTAKIKDSFLKFLKKALVGPFIPSNQQELPLEDSKKLIESNRQWVYDASIKNYRRTPESDGRRVYDACIKNYRREGHTEDCPKGYMRDRLRRKNDKTSESDSIKESRESEETTYYIAAQRGIEDTFAVFVNGKDVPVTFEDLGTIKAKSLKDAAKKWVRKVFSNRTEKPFTKVVKETPNYIVVKIEEASSITESRRTAADVSVENQGSVIVLQPLTKKAKMWIDENVSSEPWQWVGNGLVIDWRMAEELVDAMREEGLILHMN